MIIVKGKVATAGIYVAIYCIFCASTWTKVIISPLVKLLFVAGESFNCLSYIKPIRALVDLAPMKTYLKFIFSANT